MRKLCKSGIALLIAGILAACLAGAGAEEAEPGASDRAEYHLEVWCAAGRVPVAHINETTDTLESYLQTHYIPTVTVADAGKKPYLVDFEPYYFSSLSENVAIFAPTGNGFQEVSSQSGNDAWKTDGLEPGDYLMKIRIWAGVFDILYAYDCYLHVVIPGESGGYAWPVETPVPLAAPEPLPDRYLDPDGNWVTPRPDYRPVPTPMA